jgi:hypothetical protein
VVRPDGFEPSMVVKRRLKRPLPSATRDMGAYVVGIDGIEPSSRD